MNQTVNRHYHGAEAVIDSGKMAFLIAIISSIIIGIYYAGFIVKMFSSYVVPSSALFLTGISASFF
jgi:hypothetical protein